MLRPPTILNVDDYLPGRYARSRVLKDAGFAVIEAASGEEALRLVREQLPDVVLLDNNLPDISGVDVCRAIKAAPETEAIPVLQLSATSRTVENKVEAMAMGADTYLTEPLAPAELVAHVTAALRWRRAEERLRESNTRIAALYDEARRANQAKDEFLALLSHELRTPLNAMFGWIQLLRGGRLTDPQREHAIDTIERSASAQARLIEDLLDVSRIVTGQLSISSEPVDLVPVVRTAIETVRPQIDAKGLALRAHVPDEQVCVNGDASRLEQITTNLLSNAIKFTEKGTIALSLTSRDARVRLEVSDTGAGIDPDFLPYVFDRFRQADSSRTRPHGGLGLGLAISRHLVEAHGGRISVVSGGRGMGTTFTIDLPRLERSSPSLLEEEAHASRGLAERPLEGVRLLLVEDDEDSREMMTVLLEHSGARVRTAENALVALEALAERGTDVMIADVGLPHMDGYALVRRMREEGFTTPAVALTGYASSADRAQAIDAGFTDHLGKPVAPDDLVEVLLRAWRSRPAART
jgi:signal transduction histidine kinase